MRARREEVTKNTPPKFDPPLNVRNSAVYEEATGTSPSYDPDVTPAKWKKFWGDRSKKSK